MMHDVNANTPPESDEGKIILPTRKASCTSKKSLKWARVIPWYCDLHNPVRGECGLWVAVITQAMMDALSKSTDPEHLRHKKSAIHWLTGNSQDFHFVCQLAGMDADDVRRRAKKALVSPVQWRAAPREGARYSYKKHYRERMKKKRQPVEVESKSAAPLWQPASDRHNLKNAFSC